MDWIQLLTVLIANAGFFFWARSESRSDMRHMDSKLDSNRELINAIHYEMKDFHYKLLEIERKNNKEKPRK